MKYKFVAVLCLAAFAHPAMAQEQMAPEAKSGLRLEVRTSYETPTYSSVDQSDDVYKLGSALSYGGEAGYDIAVGNRVVIGPFATYEISTVSSSGGGITVSADDYLLAGMHLGYSVGPSGQIYGKVGYAQFTESVDGVVTVNTGGTVQTVAINESETGSGVGFAIGYEHSFGKNLYGRIEGGYADVGKIFEINTQRRHAGVALGVRF